MIGRVQALRAAIAQAELDGLLVLRPENRAYITGFTGSAGWVVVTAEKAYLITDFRYIEQASEQAPHFEIIRQTGDAAEVLSAKLHELGCKRLGFERDYVTVALYDGLKSALAEVDLVPTHQMVEELRQVKDEEERGLMQRATEIAEHAFLHILNQIKPGVSEREIALEMEHYMRKLGADGVAFDTIVASGTRSSLPHGRASEKLIAKGDFITMDFGALYQGYCSDMTRTVVVGQPSDKQREIYAIVLDAHMQALNSVRPGPLGKEIDAVARQVIADHGYGEYFGHGLGHGVGKVVHEGPSCGAKGETALRPGHVVTIEPGIYIPNWGGVRIEDMVMVTADGYHNFNRTSKQLIVL